MRHAHASWLLAGGADLQVVKERLGHGSIITTEKYLHSLPGGDDAALNALATIRGRSDADEESPQTGSQGRPDLGDVMEMVAKIKEMYDQMGDPTRG